MSVYDTTLIELKRNILAQKTIYKFRNFLYTINKDIRQYFFELSRNYFTNESVNNKELTATERERLDKLINHWQWNDFENNASNWWQVLSRNYSHSLTLLTLIHLWVDDIQVFDPEAFETSTMGFR